MEGNKVLVITSGGFDPLHDGHVEYLKLAKSLFNNVFHICIINNDRFLLRKKGHKVLSQEQRAKIIKELKCIDDVYYSSDDDNTVCVSIIKIFEKYHNDYNKVVFAKGGDRNKNEIPEANICKKLGIEIIDGLGNKIESSSNMIERMK